MLRYRICLHYRQKNKPLDKEKQEIKFVSKSFTALTGQIPGYGLIKLNYDVETPFFLIPRPKWELTFDQDHAKNQLQAELGQSVTLISPGTEQIDSLYGVHGVLSHEVCHFMTSEFVDGKTIPMAVEEIMAVSCEPQSLKLERLKQFKQSFKTQSIIPWQKLLTMNHPLDGSAITSKLNSNNMEYFTIKNDDPLFNKVSIYYSQVAVFEQFWRTACKEGYPIGSRLKNAGPNFNFVAWLKSGPGGCKPMTEGQFSEEMKEFVRQI